MVTHAAEKHRPNALIFPGLGLGATVGRARRVSDGMLAAAAQALADLSGLPGSL
jgi:malate dehydrogenase (oxaloacetate-decarboxylating)